MDSLFHVWNDRRVSRWRGPVDCACGEPREAPPFPALVLPGALTSGSPCAALLPVSALLVSSCSPEPQEQLCFPSDRLDRGKYYSHPLYFDVCAHTGVPSLRGGARYTLRNTVNTYRGTFIQLDHGDRLFVPIYIYYISKRLNYYTGIKDAH